MFALPSTRRVLVLDDDEVMLSLLDALLSREGYQVTLADSGAAGLQALAGGLEVELVLTDLQMPGSEAEALAGSLRRAMPHGAVLLAMSGTTPEASLRAAFDGFLLKPFDAQALTGAEQAAREAGSTRVAETSAQPPETADDSAAPVLDGAIFESLLRIIPGPKLGELYQMTLADILERYARMVTAADQEDLVTIKREAHATKGSCGMVGALELQEIAAEIEEGTSVCTSAIAEIPAACERLRRMLKSQL